MTTKKPEHRRDIPFCHVVRSNPAFFERITFTVYELDNGVTVLPISLIPKLRANLITEEKEIISILGKYAKDIKYFSFVEDGIEKIAVPHSDFIRIVKRLYSKVDGGKIIDFLARYADIGMNRVIEVALTSPKYSIFHPWDIVIPEALKDELLRFIRPIFDKFGTRDNLIKDLVYDRLEDDVINHIWSHTPALPIDTSKHPIQRAIITHCYAVLGLAMNCEHVSTLTAKVDALFPKRVKD